MGAGGASLLPAVACNELVTTGLVPWTPEMSEATLANAERLRSVVVMRNVCLIKSKRF